MRRGRLSAGCSEPYLLETHRDRLLSGWFPGQARSLQSPDLLQRRRQRVQGRKGAGEPCARMNGKGCYSEAGGRFARLKSADRSEERRVGKECRARRSVERED